MAWSFSKKEEKEIEAHRGSLLTAEQGLKDALATYNEAIRQANLALAEAVDHFNGVIQDAYQFVEELAVERRDKWEEKSEKWKESDRGQAVDYFIQEIESAVTTLGNSEASPSYAEPMTTELAELPGLAYSSDIPSDAITNMPREPEEW